MSADQFGARLLGDAQEESLEDLLQALRTTINPQPKGILCFPQVDKLLELFRYPHTPEEVRPPGETSPERHELDVPHDDDEYSARSDSRRSNNDRGSLKQRPPMVEITSPKSASGKTSLLYYLTALSLLPSSHGGKDSAVIWLDTDNHFSALRLFQVITSILLKSHPELKPKDHEQLITTCLSNVHIIRPASSPSLLSSIQSLPAYLLSPSNPSSSSPLGLIVLDSATAFQHQDRLDAELARLTDPSKTGTEQQATRSSEIIAALRRLQAQFECTILFTTAHTVPPRPKYFAAASDPPSEPEGINPWTSFATLTLHMSRIQVAQFAPGMTLEGCMRDKEKRQDLVSKGRVKIGVNAEGSANEMWPAGVREKVMGLEGKGSFVVRLGEGGIELE